ncbi:cell division protein ZapA [Spirosoma pomorum]
MEELPIHVKIADRPYKLFVEAESEAIVREAAKLIQEEYHKLQKAKIGDAQEALAQIAFSCLITKLRGDRQIQGFRQAIFDKLSQVEKTASTGSV